MRQPIEIIEAPLSVGVGLTGVEHMAGALRDAGLQRALAAVACTAMNAPFNARIVDRETALPEPQKVRAFLLALADSVERVMGAQRFPVVIGGDCTILLGCLAGAKRSGAIGLLFLDGHTDFNKPGYPDNEPASMDLYLATGRGPEILSKLDGEAPLVEERRVVCVGYRDEKYVEAAGGNTPAGTEITLLPLARFRSGGFSNMVAAALDHLCADEGAFWLHFDVDALDDEAMPAVDYRMKDGLSVGECVEIIRRARQTGRMCGIDMTIFNPTLDWDGSGARLLVDLLGAALKE
ncbi:MAG: arginase family protein [Dongiaceae bacterium]